MPPPCGLATLLKKCAAAASLTEARRLHALILTTATVYNAHSPYLYNNLLSMYGRCGSLSNARLVFDKMPHRNVVSYNALVAAFSRDNDFGSWSFRVLSWMGAEGMRPNPLTYTSLIQGCCSSEDLIMGSLLHANAVKLGMSCDVCVQTSLLGMYSNCGELGSAESVFGDVAEKDVVSWNSMVFANLKNDRVRRALNLFGELVRDDGVIPTPVTYSLALNACAKVADFWCGRVVHAKIVVSNVLADLPLLNALIDMYCSCRDLTSALCVFSCIQNPDVVSWNSMISGFARNGEGMKAMYLFVRLLGMALLRPDEYTLSAVIDATREFPATCSGKPLHGQVLKVGLSGSVYVGTALLTMYFENGDAESAQGVFDSTNEKDVVLWTEMIMGHSRLGDGETALKLFCKMCREGYRSDSFALSGALSACADLAIMKQGETIHSQAIKRGCEAEMSVCGSLIDMYAKNGNLLAAKSVFSRVPYPDLKCWNAMLGGYSHHGLVEDAILLFEEIVRSGLEPDHVTFLSLLSACSHCGLVERGRFLWSYMKENGILPGLKHYSCMVSLLGRAGLLHQAKDVITESSGSEEQLVLWRTLLSFCVNNRDLDVGLHAAEQILRLDPEDTATHTLLSNLYAAAGKWDSVAETRRKMRQTALEKQSGLSWIESKDSVHAFSSADESNPVVEDATSIPCLSQKLRSSNFNKTLHIH